MGIGRRVAGGACWAAVAVLSGLHLQPALAGAAPAALVVSGDVADLAAGEPARLVLTVRNPGGRDAVVSGLDVEVTAQDGPCAAADLRVQQWRGRLVVPASGHAVQAVAVELLRDCGPTRFALAYQAS